MLEAIDNMAPELWWGGMAALTALAFLVRGKA